MDMTFPVPSGFFAGHGHINGLSFIEINAAPAAMPHGQMVELYIMHANYRMHAARNRLFVIKLEMRRGAFGISSLRFELEPAWFEFNEPWG